MGRNVYLAIRGRLQQSRDCTDDEDLICGGCGCAASYACSAQKRLFGTGEGKTMKQHDQNPEDRLNQAIAELRGTRPDDATLDSAAERVWQHLSQHANSSTVA